MFYLGLRLFPLITTLYENTLSSAAVPAHSELRTINELENFPVAFIGTA